MDEVMGGSVGSPWRARLGEGGVATGGVYAIHKDVSAPEQGAEAGGGSPVATELPPAPGKIRGLGHGAWRTLMYLLRAAIDSVIAVAALYGAILVALSAYSQVTPVARYVSFHPGFSNGLWIAFLVMSILGFLALSVRGFLRYLDRLSERYPIIDKIGWGITLVIVLLVVGFMVYATVDSPKAHSGPAIPANIVSRPLRPQDRVLLRLQSVSKQHIGQHVFPMLLTHTIEGDAQIRRVGPGRYLVQFTHSKAQKAGGSQPLPLSPDGL